MSKRILVIEDEQNIRENLVELLEFSGFNVISSANGVEGIKAAKKNSPDLILCDVMMPQMDGYAVLHSLSKDKKLLHTPFIFLTAKSDMEDLRKGMRFGADDYLTKPYDASELLSAIETRIEKNESLKEKYSPDYNGLSGLVEDTETKLNIETVLDNSTTFSGKKNDVIYRDGAFPRDIYFIKAGRIKGVRMNEDGKELITQVWQENDFFGVVPAMNEVQYAHSAIATEEYEIIVIPIAEFQKLMNVNIEIANRFIRILAGNIELKENELLDIAYGTVRTRLADALVRLAEIYSKELNEGIPLTRYELAQYIGTAPETLIRTLKDFREDEFITMKGTKIIPNLKRLKQMKY